MKAFELTFDEEGNSPDPKLNALSWDAGFYSARQMLYELSKWNWTVDDIKRRLEKICTRSQRYKEWKEKYLIERGPETWT